MKLPHQRTDYEMDADNAPALACASNTAYTLDQSAAAVDVQKATPRSHQDSAFFLVATRACSRLRTV